VSSPKAFISPSKALPLAKFKVEDCLVYRDANTGELWPCSVSKVNPGHHYVVVWEDGEDEGSESVIPWSSENKLMERKD